MNKLYKRRVELDFSRRGGIRSSSGIYSSNRAIAASLTCCKYCGTVYLDNYVSSLHCQLSKPIIGFRGDITRRHSPTTGWSLTTYLKILHAGGMNWEAIYWHVWAACVVMRPIGYSVTAIDKETGSAAGREIVPGYSISGLDVDRYSLQPDGVLIYSRQVLKSFIIVYL